MQELVLELNKNNFKCHFCPSCDGYGCIGELPGMGGFNENINFQKNCEVKIQLPKRKSQICLIR